MGLTGRKPYTHAVAEWAAGLTEDDSAVVAATSDAKVCVLDYLGVALGSCRRPHVVAAAELFPRIDSGGATVIGTRGRYAPDHAAYLNGLIGSSGPNLDDYCKESLGHPSVGVVPAALAAAELSDATGRQFTLAVIGGYEVAMSVGAAIGRPAFDAGWHPRGGCNVLGAAIAASICMGYGPTQTVAALGLAANQAAGLLSASYFYEAWYTLSAQAAQAGFLAARLASVGYRAGTQVLEGGDLPGYCEMVAGDRVDWSALGFGGLECWISRAGHKSYPSTAISHSAIEAASQIRSQRRVRSAEVSRIVISGFSQMANQLNHAFPSDPIAASLSVPYLVARAVLDGTVTLDSLTPAILNEPEVVDLQRRIEVEIDPDLERATPEHLPARVTIEFVDGEVVSKTVMDAKGSPANPLTWDDVVEKFAALSSDVITPSRTGEIVDFVRTLEQRDNLSDLFEMITVGEQT